MNGLTLRWARTAALCALFLIVAWPAARAFRPYADKTEAKTSWMSISSFENERVYYMEVAADGAVVTRIETKDSITTRRGVIKAQLAKDFFREIESSDIITSLGGRESKLVFYKGDKLKISAYISGEIRRIDAPLTNFGEAFSYAFNEAKKAAEQLPVDTKLKGFLMAELLEERSAALQEYQAKAPKELASRTIETYEIQKMKPLMKAIKQPYRLIPLESENEVKGVQTFITTHKLYGLRKLFYLPSTRGTFKCLVLDAARFRPAPPAAPAIRKNMKSGTGN